VELEEPLGAGGARFIVRRRGAVVEKTGAPGPLSREAAALRRVAGRGVAPALVRAAPGEIATQLIRGRTRDLTRIGDRRAEALGELLRRAHDTGAYASGGLAGRRARSLGAYRRRRAEDALRAAGGGNVDLAHRVIAALPPFPPVSDSHPFRLLHGDLVASNVVWGGDGPMLVDWEFWRPGDPAEDLAYLAEVNRLPGRLLARVLAGYDRQDVAVRIDAWRPLVALDAGLWYASAAEGAEAERLLDRAVELSSPA
jgi:aminoglycoside phosphotransferase (APT) family kinase protein